MSNEEKDLPPQAPPQSAQSEAPAGSSNGKHDAVPPAPQAAAPETRETPAPSREEEFPSGPVAPREDVPQPEEPEETEESEEADGPEDAGEDDGSFSNEPGGPAQNPPAPEAAAGPASASPQRPAEPPQPGQNRPGGEGHRQGQQPGREGGRRRRRGRGGRSGQAGEQRGQDQRGQEQRGERKNDGRQGERGQERRGSEGHRERGGQERHKPQQRSAHADHGRGERGHHEHVHRGPERNPRKPVKREILANTSFEEIRIAIMEDGRLAELLWERKSEESIVGNIYKGVVENVLPGISSAFVNIGFEKNAYLYISDVLGERGAPIDATLKKGQHIMIQVAKEAIGTKGMKVTMDVSLPGRYLVFTPYQNYVGVSKHIEDAAERQRLSGIVDKLVADVLGGKGIVVRTEAEGASAEELEREVKYLLQTWQNIQKKFESTPPPTLLHKDLDLTLQVARDILSDQTYVYLIDSKEAFKNVVEFIEGISPELKDKVRLYEAKTPIFKAFELDAVLEDIRQTKVPLPNGGSIIIQEAESLCAIDVNTGRFTGSKSQEETVTQTNIEAAQEVAHQIRLRNIGGIIVVDFIDMRKASNRNKVMESFAQACRNDRAKIRILPITRLGLIEMTRERKRQSTGSLITDECPECRGAGRVLSGETIRIRIQREIFEMTGGRPGGQVRLLLHPGLAELFRSQQAVIEKNVQRSVKIASDPQLPWEDYRIILE
ncbi:MAG: Rne/Rng family ribonuclease [Elusimicrobia bacterium]|nr:Rne/Rng family ribonuclease [Elusimicrobiota bacterium]